MTVVLSGVQTVGQGYFPSCTTLPEHLTIENEFVLIDSVDFGEKTFIFARQFILLLLPLYNILAFLVLLIGLKGKGVLTISTAHPNSFTTLDATNVVAF